MVRVALGAVPLPDGQVLYCAVLIAAARTELAAGIQGRDPDEVIAIPGGFVFQHGKEHGPGNTGDGSCQLMVADHPFHAQVLNADGLVFAHQHGGLLLEEIPPLVCDLFVDPCYPEALLSTVV